MSVATAAVKVFLDAHITELFLVGVFAVIATELVKKAFRLTESSIGIHDKDGKLLKTRYAAMVFAIVIGLSNVLAFATYEYLSHLFASHLPLFPILADVFILVLALGGIYGYLKTRHYRRETAS